MFQTKFNVFHSVWSHYVEISFRISTTVYVFELNESVAIVREVGTGDDHVSNIEFMHNLILNKFYYAHISVFEGYNYVSERNISYTVWFPDGCSHTR